MNFYFTLNNVLLQIAAKGIYKQSDNYIYHLQMPSNKEIFIVTSQRVMCINRSFWTDSYKVFYIVSI